MKKWTIVLVSCFVLTLLGGCDKANVGYNSKTEEASKTAPDGKPVTFDVDPDQKTEPDQKVDFKQSGIVVTPVQGEQKQSQKQQYQK